MKRFNKLQKALVPSLAAVFLLSACGSSQSATGTDSNVKSSSSETADSGSTASSESESTEPAKLTIAVMQHSNDILTDVGQKAILQEAVETLGYEVEWISIMEGNDSEKTAGLLTDNQVDVYWGILNDDQILKNAELFLPIEDYIEEYCPNVYAAYQDNMDGWKQYLTYPDGHIYGMMGGFMNSVNNSVNGTFWINKTWLDDLGMKIPTTMAELEAALVAFRDNDMDGDGDTGNEIPLDFCQAHYAAKWYEMAHCFGLPVGPGRLYSIENGTVTPIANSESFREFLEYYHGLISDGLANIEGLTQNSEQYNANLSNGIVGAFWGWAPYTYISDKEKAAEYVAVAPISADGYTFSVADLGINTRRNSWVIASKCENWEAALKLWDYLSRDQDVCYQMRYGVEGLAWEYVDGVATARDYTKEEALAAGYPEDISSHAGTSAFPASIGIINVHPLIIDSLAPTAGTNAAVRGSAVQLYQPYLDEAMSKAIVPDELAEEFSFTCEGLLDYVNNFVAEAILNGVTDDSWETYLKQLDNYNYDYYIEYNQKVYDSDF